MSSPSGSLIHQAIAHFHQGNLGDAEALLANALQIEPENFDALHVMGVICVHQHKQDEARGFFEKAIAINPGNSVVQFNLAAILSESGNNRVALPHHEAAVKLAPHNPNAWLNYGKCLSHLKRYDEALDCYQQALKINPDFPQALSNQGVLLAEQQRNEEALSCFTRALALVPGFPAAWLNKADLLCSLKRYDEALEHYERAIQLAPDNADIRHKTGNVLNEIKRHHEALAQYEQVILLQPDRDYIYGDRLSTKMTMCDWADTDVQLLELSRKIRGGQQAATPFEMLNFKDDPALQKKTAAIYAHNFPANHVLGAMPQRASREKIRVAYYSKDFGNHATAFLAAELFELHDRNQFEIIAFSFGPDTNDPMRNRLMASFDRFIDVRDMADQEIAQRSRDIEIDIAVDLQGYQTEHRPGIFACRAAPIQVNYLAYPGTMGSGYMDYIVADKTLIPPASQTYYSEKIVYLPDSYQANDRQRAISDRQFTRDELGLPQTGFVFCCFNNIFKITPRVFDAWMHILSQVSGSVLWLSEGSPMALQNLRKEAVSKGISAERLIFARHMDLPDHLARHRLADLFLDTHPYNAHTTASDALWAGLPVLTCPGESFASRVASSLLQAIHMPELIARSEEDYAQLAIELATNPARLAGMKRKLSANRLTTPLFDTPRYVKHIEAAYMAMHNRYRANLPAEHIYVG